MSYRFLHVGFAFHGRPRVLDLEPGFAAFGDDWIRYSPLGWIVWTRRGATDLFWHLRSYIDADDQVLVAPMSLAESFGNLTPWIWGWMAEKDPSVKVMLGPTAELAAAQFVAKREGRSP
ncbi:MAG: hypothetical protein ACHP84_04235 [Caulobacterales bacterium]